MKEYAPIRLPDAAGKMVDVLPLIAHRCFPRMIIREVEKEESSIFYKKSKISAQQQQITKRDKIRKGRHFNPLFEQASAKDPCVL